jgi:transposase
MSPIYGGLLDKVVTSLTRSMFRTKGASTVSLSKEPFPAIPRGTKKLVEELFSKHDNLYVKLEKRCSSLFFDMDYSAIYPTRGRPGFHPVFLMRVTLIQFIEGLSDREFVKVLPSRLDWKYFLHLPLNFKSFDASVLSDFRRIISSHDASDLILDAVLQVAKDLKLLKADVQRTDSTHVLASVRDLNRLELVYETFRTALESAAECEFDFVNGIARPNWSERYALPCFNFRIPKCEKKKAEWLASIADDGRYLLEVIDKSGPSSLKTLPSMGTLRKVWEQQIIFAHDDRNRGRLRNKDEHKVEASDMIVSPHDVDARLGTKRTVKHKGYKAHFTESLDEGFPHLITNVETTVATTTDIEMRPKIEAALTQKNLAPKQHLVDSGYTDVETIMEARDNGVDVVGPIRQTTHWQVKAGKGFDLSHFIIDWENEEVTCPAGKVSNRWSLREKEHSIHVKFSKSDCTACPFRDDCTKGSGPRTI